MLKWGRFAEVVRKSPKAKVQNDRGGKGEQNGIRFVGLRREKMYVARDEKSAI